jgi:PhnB protein
LRIAVGRQRQRATLPHGFNLGNAREARPLGNRYVLREAAPRIEVGSTILSFQGTENRMLKKDKQRAPVAGYLVVRSLDDALKFYKKVFDAKENERYEDNKGKVWYSVLNVYDSPLQIMEPFKDMALVATSLRAKASAGDSSMLSVVVDDVDAVFKKAIKAGGKSVIEPHDAYWGDRYAEFRDPFGHRWSCCGKSTTAQEISNPADAKKRFKNFLEEHNNPSSPATAGDIPVKVKSLTGK